MTPPVLRVLVVDDSAVVRQGLTQVLTRVGGMSVDIASDPLIALSMLQRSKPDVIVLDLEMPRMDGLTFLRRLMQESPLPVVVCSALAGAGSEAALQALEEGAVEVIAKPQLGVADFLRESAVQLVDVVRGAALARQRCIARVKAHVEARLEAPRPPGALLSVTTDRVVAVGASTGGTDALRQILEAMPPDCPGLVIVQHLPEQFTSAFARHLQQRCRIEVKEAVDGDRVREGRALIAPGSRHLQVARSGGHYRVEVMSGPLVCRHRPSVDVLFHSTARAAGRNAVGILLTGMGDDGADGLLAMKKAGAATLAQDEASCVVFGMPREAIGRGAVDEVVPLERIAEALLRRARAPRA
jgi:two-component system chemotaxis response regulator CheB